MITSNLMSNVMLDMSKNIVPEVGMGITVCSYSDRSAGTIWKVNKNKKSFWFTYDDTKRIDSHGVSDFQEYEYTQNPNDPLVRVSLRKNGKYRISAGDNRAVILNRRDAFFDYSF